MWGAPATYLRGALPSFRGPLAECSFIVVIVTPDGDLMRFQTNPLRLPLTPKVRLEHRPGRSLLPRLACINLRGALNRGLWITCLSVCQEPASRNAPQGSSAQGVRRKSTVGLRYFGQTIRVSLTIIT